MWFSSCVGIGGLSLLCTSCWAVANSAADLLEQAFLEVPSAEGAAAHLKTLTEEPHIAGSLGDQKTASYVAAQFRAYGLEHTIESIEALVSYPTRAPVLVITDKDGSDTRLDVLEHAVPEDATSAAAPHQYPFHGYSPSGDVTAEVVYANFGMPEDFEKLRLNSVSVEGRIVLVRYGRCLRGLKVRNAQNNGAIGVVMYNDPEQEGFSMGQDRTSKEYPAGPWRPAFGVERGSVVFGSLCGGDPSRSAGPHIV